MSEGKRWFDLTDFRLHLTWLSRLSHAFISRFYLVYLALSRFFKKSDFILKNFFDFIPVYLLFLSSRHGSFISVWYFSMDIDGIWYHWHDIV